jgi:hypothetical protein
MPGQKSIYETFLVGRQGGGRSGGPKMPWHGRSLFTLFYQTSHSHHIPNRQKSFTLTAGPQNILNLCIPRRGEEQQSLGGEGGGDPIQTTGKKAWHSVYSVLLSISAALFIYN